MSSAANRGSTFTEQARGTGEQMMGSAQESLGQLAHTLRERAQDLASQASHLASQMGDTARDWASSFAGGAGRAWDTTSREARHLASQAWDRAEDAWDGASGFVRRHPIPSLLVAVGVGFMLYELLNNRRRSSSPW